MTRKSSIRDNTDLFVYDIVKSAEQAMRLASGRSRPDYDGDEALQLALVHLLQTIGEAARNVPENFRVAHPDIAWPKIVATRNRIVHEYWRIDLDQVWSVVQEELQPLVDALRPFVKPED